MDRIRENKKVVLLAILGIVAVIGAVVIVKPFGGGGDSSPDMEYERVAVYSLVDISEGDTITDEMIGTREISEDESVNPYEYESDVVGAEALVSIAADEYIQYGEVEVAHIEESINSSDLSSKIPEGLRAVLIPTGSVQEMVNYLSVGDKVDILVTHSKEGGQETITPFQNVEILMIGENIDMPAPTPVEGEEGAHEDVHYSGSTSSIILAMSPEKAEVILNMRMTGVLETAQITLRNAEDEEIKSLGNFGEGNFEDWRNR